MEEDLTVAQVAVKTEITVGMAVIARVAADAGLAEVTAAVFVISQENAAKAVVPADTGNTAKDADGYNYQM